MNHPINTLVKHKNKTLGIGCVSKVLNKSYKVNFGLEDVVSCKEDVLEVIDTSKCKTVTSQEFSRRILSDKSTLNNCIVGNELKEYVGIGWITLRVITEEDLKKYPRVI
jgi:hypothetical protein